MNSDQIWAVIDAQRSGLAELLEPLTPEQWTTPSLCDRPMPTEAAVEVANRLWRMRFPMNPARRLQGVRLVATDTDFAVGQGREVRAPIRDVVMILAGRQQP